MHTNVYIIYNLTDCSLPAGSKPEAIIHPVSYNTSFL